MERPNDWRDEQMQICVSVRTIDAAIAALKASTTQLHELAVLTRNREHALNLRLQADAADVAAEELRRQVHQQNFDLERPT